MSKLKELLTQWSTKGMKLPFVYDPESKAPSVTLSFAYITFFITVISVAVLHFRADPMVASGGALLFWVLATVFYRLRKLDKVKIDLDDQEIELDSEEEQPKNNSKEGKNKE